MKGHAFLTVFTVFTLGCQSTPTPPAAAARDGGRSKVDPRAGDVASATKPGDRPMYASTGTPPPKGTPPPGGETRPGGRPSRTSWFASEALTPEENAAVFGSTAGLAAGGIARAAGASTTESIVIGAATAAVAGNTAYVIAKHQSTKRQRRIAEQRARKYYGRLAPEKKVTEKKKVRYLAVDTEKTDRTSPKARKVIMIWDTSTNALVNETIYDLQNPPAVGVAVKVETYSCEYIGSRK